MNYQRLPGRFVLPWTRQSLYLGSDHILRVKLTLFSEEYRRFYLRDIETMVMVEKGSGGSYYFIAGGIFLLVMSVILAYSFRFISGGFSFFVGLVLLLIGLQMPTCASYLRTASTAERLPSLGRIGAARRALAILSPAIEAAQRQEIE